MKLQLSYDDSGHILDCAKNLLIDSWDISFSLDCGGRFLPGKTVNYKKVRIASLSKFSFPETGKKLKNVFSHHTFNLHKVTIKDIKILNYFIKELKK